MKSPQTPQTAGLPEGGASPRDRQGSGAPLPATPSVPPVATDGAAASAAPQDRLRPPAGSGEGAAAEGLIVEGETASARPAPVADAAPASAPAAEPSGQGEGTPPRSAREEEKSTRQAAAGAAAAEAGPASQPAPGPGTAAAEGANPAPAAPAAPPSSPGRILAYVSAGLVIALAQGMRQGFSSVNIPTIAGDLGITTTEASWLMAAYLIPRSSLPLMLIKIRSQFGLRRFAEVGIVSYVLVSFLTVWTDDLRSAVVIEFLAGIASGSLSSLAFLYILEPLPQAWKMRFGLPMAMCAMMIGTPLARVVSPPLIGDGGLAGIHLTGLGMAVLSLALVFRLPLTPVPHQKVIKPLDLVSFLLIAFGFGGMVVGCIMGPIHFWTAVPWIGWLLAAAIAALATAAMIEIRRENPLLDVRWLASPAMLHLTAALFLFRLILSEQSAGAPRMFQVLGVSAGQLVVLFAVICLATVIGALACVAWIKPGREPQFHLVALALIAAGAWMDSHATIDTRPAQMLISQVMIGVAGMLFMPPAMMAGLMAALKKGPNYILSFVIVFLSTQSIGGALGSGAFTTLINWRQAAHLQALAEQLQATSTQTLAAIAARAAQLAPQIADPALLRGQAMAQIAQEAGIQAYVMAYNDVYFLTFLIALAGGAALLLHLLRDRLHLRLSPPDADPAPATPSAIPPDSKARP